MLLLIELSMAEVRRYQKMILSTSCHWSNMPMVMIILQDMISY